MAYMLKESTIIREAFKNKIEKVRKSRQMLAFQILITFGGKFKLKLISLFR